VTLTHLQCHLLHGDLAEDSSAVVGTDGPQLVFVEGEELSAGQHAEAGDGAEGEEGSTTHTWTHLSYTRVFPA